MTNPRYCWRLGHHVPMLSEVEWNAVATRLRVSFLLAKGMDYTCGLDRDAQQSAATVRRAYALDMYYELTGHRLQSPWLLYYVRDANYGPDCARCDKPLRTPRAAFCAECGLRLSVPTTAAEQA